MLKDRSDFEAFYQSEANVSDYDRLRSNTPKKRIVRRIERNFFTAPLQTQPLKDESRILEIGCGTGFITQALSKYAPVLAIDLSPTMLDSARTRSYSHPVEFREHSLFDLPTLNESFDYVVSSRVILHLAGPDVRAALHAIGNVMNAEASLLFDLQRPNLLRGILNHFRADTVYNFPFRHAEVRSLVQSTHGFRLQELQPIDHGTLLAPVHLVNNALQLNAVEQAIFKLETGGLSGIRTGMDRWGVHLVKTDGTPS